MARGFALRTSVTAGLLIRRLRTLQLAELFASYSFRADVNFLFPDELMLEVMLVRCVIAM